MTARGESWVRTSAPTRGAPSADGLCYAQAAWVDPQTLTGDSVNALARAVLEWFLDDCRDERFTGEWPLQVYTEKTVEGLGQRARAVERQFRQELAKRLARVERLARPQPAAPRGLARGLFLFLPDFRTAQTSREAVLGGQRRMADDPGAPSRSYLKVEEAYGVLGREPAAGETVVDLGAAPGGWSYSAAKRGARVLALDNGPLKGAAKGHPLIQHELVDGFQFAPATGKTYDWFFCDIVDDPDKVLGLLERWVERRWCRRFIVNLKFGRSDPVPRLARATGAGHPLPAACAALWARHLFHDREEFTLVGELRA